MKKLLLISVIISLGFSSVMSQTNDLLEVEPGFVRINGISMPFPFLGIDELGVTPNLVVSANIYNDYPDENLNIYIDKISTSTQYIMAFGAVKIGDYIKGKYIFNPRAAGADQSYMWNMQYGLGVINAIRTGDVLYVLGDEDVTDVSTLEGLASEGRIRKVDLSEDKSFIFSFVLVEQYSTDFLIKSAVSDESEFVRFQNGVAVLINAYPEDAISYADIFSLQAVEGSLEEDPTSIAQSKGAFEVYTSDGRLYINSPEQADISVYGISGALVKRLKVNADENVAFSLPQGAYVVVVGETSKKVVIK